MSTEKIELKKTVNLPKTDFPIRAGLATKEPELIDRWATLSLDRLRQQPSSNHASYHLHDGPPYPNGNIHTGHALNKILKDIILRTKTMSGLATPFRPGWDCHGLPIETQVLKKAKASTVPTDPLAFRQDCETFARDYVATQKSDFKRLGISADWENPYLTLTPEYEVGVVRAFAQLAEQGLVYEGKKPIHWCCSCETALAEAEIEYDTHQSPSITVKFHVKHASARLAEAIGTQSACLWVWTTTPWTLPANVALAVNPNLPYAIVQTDSELTIVAESRLAALGLTDAPVKAIVTGADLCGTITKHPFLSDDRPIIDAEFVSSDDGTGIVHIAPGHGQDDYIAGLRHNLPIVMPVNDRGIFTEEAGQWAGQFVFKANAAINDHIQSLGNLVDQTTISHSYPHCWRCHKAVIFRATKQWFIAMDTPMKRNNKTLRESALQSIKQTTWVPDWGENRITAMITNRPDWCVSRQRKWGIPIPAVRCVSCETAHVTGDVATAIQTLIGDRGTNAWFSEAPESFLPPDLTCTTCQGTVFTKESDILDVWFESGSSFMSVIDNQADLYLEGSDQHRGWFQSSLLIGLGATDQAPFKTVLTHGFINDEHGKKMSKSKGNVTSPADITRDYGADILRWWVASCDFKDDVKLSKNALNQARDSFLKVRNTIRFLLSNLYDYSISESMPIPDQSLDQWICVEANALNTRVQDLYNQFLIHRAVKEIHDFCAITLSSLYLDIVKDRLYCGGANSPERRSTQSAIYHVVSILLKLTAPIMVFTADDAYHHINQPNSEASIHLCHFHPIIPIPQADALRTTFNQLLSIRDQVYKACEALRAQKIIGSFLEAHVDLTITEPLDCDDWAAFLIVSQVDVRIGNAFSVSVRKTTHEKCERCWRHQPINNDIMCTRCSESIKEYIA